MVRSVSEAPIKQTYSPEQLAPMAINYREQQAAEIQVVAEQLTPSNYKLLADCLTNIDHADHIARFYSIQKAFKGFVGEGSEIHADRFAAEDSDATDSIAPIDINNEIDPDDAIGAYALLAKLATAEQTYQKLIELKSPTPTHLLSSFVSELIAISVDARQLKQSQMNDIYEHWNAIRATNYWNKLTPEQQEDLNKRRQEARKEGRVSLADRLGMSDGELYASVSERITEGRLARGIANELAIPETTLRDYLKRVFADYPELKEIYRLSYQKHNLLQIKKVHEQRTLYALDEQTIADINRLIGEGENIKQIGSKLNLGIPVGTLQELVKKQGIETLETARRRMQTEFFASPTIESSFAEVLNGSKSLSQLYEELSAQTDFSFNRRFLLAKYTSWREQQEQQAQLDSITLNQPQETYYEARNSAAD